MPSSPAEARGSAKRSPRGRSGRVNLVLLARGKEALDQAAEEIHRETDVQVVAMPADITKMQAVDAAAAATADRFGS